MACLQGTIELETQGMSDRSKHRELLQKAEKKQSEAVAKDRQAEENERASKQRER